MESTDRRDFLKSSTTTAAALAVSGIATRAHSAEDNTIRIALVGCGGRGTGAAKNALAVDNGPIELVAVADVFENRQQLSVDSIKAAAPEKVNIPDDQRFIGFNAYQQAMDCLRPGDVVILATPPAFRWVHYSYAIDKGLNVFMEKPVTIDAPTSRRMLEINKGAVERNLKVGVGLMCRHCDARRELFDRIQNGEIGDISMMRAYRMAGPTASAHSKPNDGSMPDLMYQIKRFHSFLWLSGGAVSDFLIHNIDETCWMKNDWPVKVHGVGGRHYRDGHIDQNFDSYAMEYTFKDGAKMFVDGRTIANCKKEFASYAHGTKGLAVISTASHSPAKSRIYDGHNEDKSRLKWSFGRKEPNPYQLEWNHLIAAIRNDEEYNEVQRGVMASAVTSMGRMAAHTGREITLEKFMNHDHEFGPGIDKLVDENSTPPIVPNAKGEYPIPAPGIVTDQEYLS